jgi:hypothetical protein
LIYPTSGSTGPKLHLFSVACCRGIWPLLGGPERAAVDAAELIADGRGDALEIRRALDRQVATDSDLSKAREWAGALQTAEATVAAVVQAVRIDAWGPILR